MIDTNKAREMRVKGTDKHWDWDPHPAFSERITGDDGGFVAEFLSEDDAGLAAYAVNNLAPMADEIDRLRAALRDCRDELCAHATSRTSDGDTMP